MGMMYSAAVEAVAVTVAQDFAEILAPSDAVVILHSVYVGQHTEEGDAAAEMLQINIVRYATSGSGGSAGVENPHEIGFPAAGSVVEFNNTTQGGTPVVLLADSFNVQAGWQYRPTPEERLVISPSGILAIELPTAPADSITFDITITWEEIGG